MKRKFLGFFVIVLLFLVIIGISPYAKLYYVYHAYKQGNVAPLLQMMNYQVVQQDIKVTLSTRFETTLATKPEFAFLAKLAPDMADHTKTNFAKEMDKTIANAITKDNLSQLLSNQISHDSKKLVFFWAVASDYVDYGRLLKDLATADTHALIANQEPIIRQKIIARFGKPVPTKPDFAYCGFDCFVVSGAVSGQPIGITMKRTGLMDWQIVAVDLP